MTRPTRSTFCLWLSLAIGLMAICGLLLAVRPTAVACPPQEQPADAVVLWLVPPETSPAPGPWPLIVEAHQAGWRAQSAVVRERLAALETQGHIGGFEPLPGDVGFVVTAPAGLPPEACRELSRTVRRWPKVAHISALDEATPEPLAARWRQGLDIASTVRPAPSSARQVTTLTLNLGLYSRLVSGAAPRPEPIALSLTRDDEVIANATATPFPDGTGGYLYAATLYETYYRGGGGGGYCYPFVEPGDILQAIQAGQTLSLTVPLLTALADQSTATVYGQAPSSATLEVYFYRYGDPGVAYQQTVTATTAGDYHADFGGLTLVTPRDYGYVFHADGDEAGNHVYARYNVPFLRIGIETNYADGLVAPCTTITATLHDDAGALRDLAYDCSSSDGTFSLDFYPTLQVGDTVVVTAAGQVVSVTVPALTACPDPPSDVISGEAPPGAPVQVDLYRGPLGYEYTYGPPSGEPDHSLSITATLTGTYTANFTGLADVVAGDYGVVYVTNAAGHQAYRRFAVPFLQARLGDYRLTGQVNGGEQVTVTVWGSSGVPRDVHFVQVYDNGYFYDYDWQGGLRLLVGDQVTVTAQDGEETGLTAPLLTAYADQTNSTVYGQAPPNSPLRVEVSRYWHPPGLHVTGGGYSYIHILWVTSTTSGVYTADFSSLTTFQPGYEGAVFYVNPEGHEIYLEFSVPVVPSVRVQSGGNYVEGVLPVESEQIAITLRDASGQVKATATTWACYKGSFEVYLYQDWDVPAIIEAGDTVEVAAGGTLPATPTPTPTPWPNGMKIATGDTLVTVVVPTLTVQAGPAADVIFGQAPPNAPLEVTWSDSDWWSWTYRTWTVTSTAAGTYTLDLSGEVDLEQGDEVEVTWTDENGNEVWVAQRVPRLEAALGDKWVSVLGPVYSPLTLTLLSANGVPLYTGTATLDRSGHATLYLYDASCDPLHLKADQTLVADLAGEGITVTLPYLTARADPLADTVSGEAPPGARLMVSVHYYWSDYLLVTATVTGTYSADFSGVVDIGSSSSGEVIYLHPDGHRVTLDYAVPHVEVTLGEAYVSGVTAGPGVVTVTLRDAGGIFKGSGVDTSWYSNWFYVYLTDAQGEPAPVAGGDVVIVEAAGSVMTYTVPALTAAFDQRTDILTGTAPAGAWLQITLGGGSRQVQAGPDGAYAMDWSDLSPRLGEQGNVAHTDELGNQARLYFIVPYYNSYLPLINKER